MAQSAVRTSARVSGIKLDRGYIWARFKKDRFSLSLYSLLNTAFLLVVIAALLRFDTWHPKASAVAAALAVVLGVILGIKIPTYMHNCMHGNLKRANRLVGEVSSFFILMNFPIVSLLHTLHHAYPDSEWDPHSPDGQSFWQYFFTSQFRGARLLERKFCEFHGDTRANELIFKVLVTFLHFLGNALRLVIFYLVLGDFFFWFYLPAFASYLFVFSHVNYVTHGRVGGRTQITNLNSNLYYRFVNFVCDGVYFHKNHHAYPRAYNPQLFREVSRCSTHTFDS